MSISAYKHADTRKKGLTALKDFDRAALRVFELELERSNAQIEVLKKRLREHLAEHNATNPLTRHAGEL